MPANDWRHWADDNALAFGGILVGGKPIDQAWMPSATDRSGAA